MVDVLDDLLDISCLNQFDPLLYVEGHFVAEVFSGKSAMSLAALVLGVPAIAPWDVDRSRTMDVRRNGRTLWAFAASGRVGWNHSGTPCTSLTWARDPQLRSWTEVQGKASLNAEQARKADDGNCLCLFSVILAVIVWLAGGVFSIENPWLSWLWLQPCFLALRTLAGVAFLKVYYTSYDCPYHKPTGFLHCIRGLNELHRSAPEFEATVVLRGRVLWQGEWVFRTLLAQPYPPSLAEAVASRAVPAMLALRQPDAGAAWQDRVHFLFVLKIKL